MRDLMAWQGLALSRLAQLGVGEHSHCFDAGGTGVDVSGLLSCLSIRVCAPANAPCRGRLACPRLRIKEHARRVNTNANADGDAASVPLSVNTQCKASRDDGSRALQFSMD